MAVPSDTLGRETALVALVDLGRELDVVEYIVGLPLALAGTDTASTADARAFARDLMIHSGIPVRLVDERLTTVTAQGALHSAHHSTRSSRAVIDSVAATILLDTVLEAEKRGNTLGEMVGGQ